jgi:crotonobetainyl-CoA:carnitine CoA-transferase CaiB-like acyl-CoA transferase
MLGPWSGVRVLDLTGPAGAYGTRLLAGLGADVIALEPPEGNRMRAMAPFAPGVEAPESSLWWAFFGQGKRSVVGDLATDAGRDRFRRLAATADVVVEDAGPGALDALGVGHGELRAANPGLVWVAISPFGLTGPRRRWKGSDLLAWAGSGLAYTIGFPDRPPLAPGGPVQLAMHLTSLNAATAALLALRARRRLGHGQLVDISMQECCLSIAPETGVPVWLDDQVPRPRPGNRRAITRPFGLYPASDGYVALIVLQPAHWKAMSAWVHEATGVDALLDAAFEDIAVRWEAADFVDEMTELLTTQYTKLELFGEGQRRGIPISPVNTVADLVGDPHLAEAGFWRTEDHPRIGALTGPGSPWRDNASWWSWSRAPLLGEHTSEVTDGL